MVEDKKYVPKIEIIRATRYVKGKFMPKWVHDAVWSGKLRFVRNGYIITGSSPDKNQLVSIGDWILEVAPGLFTQAVHEYVMAKYVEVKEDGKKIMTKDYDNSPEMKMSENEKNNVIMQQALEALYRYKKSLVDGRKTQNHNATFTSICESIHALEKNMENKFTDKAWKVFGAEKPSTYVNCLVLRDKSLDFVLRVICRMVEGKYIWQSVTGNSVPYQAENSDLWMYEPMKL